MQSINNRFMTNFDESSFMMAYRFPENNGRKYELPSMGIVKTTAEIDAPEEKYKATKYM